MEFDHAAQRLARDQSKLKRENRRSARGVGNRTGPELSSGARRQAEMQRKMAEQRSLQRQREQRELEYQEHYVRECDRNLHARRLCSGTAAAPGGGTTAAPGGGTAATTTTGGLQLQPTSIHGEGDKIALPPSVLEFLTSSSSDNGTGNVASPWTFRIGLLNPNYSFPASPLVQILRPPDDEDDSDNSDSDDDDTNNSKQHTAAYLDELRHKYLAYTHGTVVEFTQDEGCVGLPGPIAAALLEEARSNTNARGGAGDATGGSDFAAVKVKRTVDPSSSSSTEKSHEAMDVDDEKTPGHLAWGAFDLPDMPVEVSLVQLPKGRACRLVPTRQAVTDGFYGLKDIKLVLEQSLIRTRATLSVGDAVRAWHRGHEYDLVVSAVTPPSYGAVTCINTDIEVEFGEAEGGERMKESVDAMGANASVDVGGRVLASSASGPSKSDQKRTVSAAAAQLVALSKRELLPEPPAEQTEGACTIQIRGDGAHGKRRFDVGKATVEDLFAFAVSVLPKSAGGDFRLVTRFPRRVLTLGDEGNHSTLAQVGIQPGQELFMLERL